MNTKLQDILKPFASAWVCISGGLDSCLLLKAVYDMMGDHVQAITFQSPLQTQRSIRHATVWANKLGVRQWMIDYHPLEEEGIKNNSSDRCFYCKMRMFAIAYDLIAEKDNKTVILDGTHLGDDPLLRPGIKANKAFGIRSPWQEMRLGKEDIRRIAREEGLPFWDMPSDSCLATRFPSGFKLTAKMLAQLESAEELLMERGLRDFRLRPADTPPRLILSDEDYSRAQALGIERIWDLIHEKTGWDLKKGILEKRKQ